MVGYQQGIVSRQQATSFGMRKTMIRSRLDSGRWRRIYPGVYATFTGPLIRDAQLWAAILHAGAGAMLSHETAAELDGLLDEPSQVIHVTIPEQRRIRPVRGLVVHRYSHLRDIRFPPGEQPRTWAEDAVLDIAETKDDFDDVCALVTAAFGRHLTTVAFMRMALAERKRHRWRNDIDELITEAADGTHSVLEFRYDRDVERAHRLPSSRRQVPFRKKNGSRGFRDRVYEPYGVIIELDGKLAHPGDRRWEDKERDNAAAVDARQSLRYGWRHVRRDPCGTAAQVAAVLQIRGWRGSPRPCSPKCPVSQ